jgi:hypothetical protein
MRTRAPSAEVPVPDTIIGPVDPERPEQYNPDQDIGSLEGIAKSLGCELVTGTDSQLTIDLDGDAAIKEFDTRYDMLIKYNILPPHEYPHQSWVSRSGKGKHVVIQLHDTLPLEERLLFQALLGSDWKRDAFAISRRNYGNDNELVLFKPLDPMPELPIRKPDFVPDPYNFDDDLPF